MGQKINPIGFRLGINRTWDSRWFADNAEYGQLLHEDLKIRAFVMEELKQAGIAKVVIERPHKKCRVTIHSARPGLIIGKKGADIEKLRKKTRACGTAVSVAIPYRKGMRARSGRKRMSDARIAMRAIRR